MISIGSNVYCIKAVYMKEKDQATGPVSFLRQIIKGVFDAAYLVKKNVTFTGRGAPNSKSKLAPYPINARARDAIIGKFKNLFFKITY